MSVTQGVPLIIAVCVGALALGCAGPSITRGPGPEQSVTIELLGFPGCPNTPALRDNLRAALRDLGSPAFIDTDQMTLPEDDPRRGWPTPTILVNGRDLFGMPEPTSAAMGCRMYPGGVPSVARVREALAAAIRAP